MTARDGSQRLTAWRSRGAQVDSAAAAFLAPIGVVEFIAIKLGERNPLRLQLGPQQAELVSRQLKNRMVRCTHNQRKMRVRGVASHPAAQRRFVDSSGSEVTVPAYFERQYGIQLQVAATYVTSCYVL